MYHLVSDKMCVLHFADDCTVGAVESLSPTFQKMKNGFKKKNGLPKERVRMRMVVVMVAVVMQPDHLPTFARESST